MATANEIINRTAKAVKLAAHLFAYDIHSSQVAIITPREWSDFATTVRLATPSTETISQITDILRAFEGARQQRDIESSGQPFDFKL